MFFRYRYKNDITPFHNRQFKNISYIHRKEAPSPEQDKRGSADTPSERRPGAGGAFFFASLRASLTIEAAAVLSLFVLVMTAVLQYGKVLESSVRYASALTETAEELATAGYGLKYAGNDPVAGAVLSQVYAAARVLGEAGNSEHTANENFLLSSVPGENDMIDLRMTYSVRSIIGGVKLPFLIFVQRGAVRAWTGREGAGTGAGSGDESEDRVVYVTETGTVYHTHEDCSHIRLKIEEVSVEDLETRRNSSGEIYHACEHCGKNPGGRVYITAEGNRYHTSLECSGLKRTVHEVHEGDLNGMHKCSKCAARDGE